MTTKLLLAILPILALAPMALADTETQAQYDARMKWWREARYGMFIHWDMSSVAGSEISWSRHRGKAVGKPLDIFGNAAGYSEDPFYDHLYEKFNPTKFDAKAWVKVAKDAGMKYVVFTAKHHGGFCMWDTKLTDYSIMHSPFKRDVVKELADACHEAGIHFGIYYSPRDWHQPDYGVGDNSKYTAYMKGQLTELLTNYGKVDVVWFDSFGHGVSIKFWHADEMLELVHKLQPQAVVNDRCKVFCEDIGSLKGDFDTPEQTLGSYKVNRAWESCMCMTPPHWSYVPGARLVGLPECLRNLVGCATGDGNLLLDVGPNALGEIPDGEVKLLTEMGKWLDKNGDSIYSTRGGPFRNGKWGGATFKENKVFLHAFDGTPDTFVLPELKQKFVSAKNLGGGEVKVEEKDGRIVVNIPKEGRSPIDTVIELTFDQPVTRVDGSVDLKK